MIDNLIAKNPTSTNPNDKVLVVLDAGISTEENLKLIKDKEVKFRICSNPTEKAKAIYTALRYNKTPFRKMKLCRTQ